MQTKPGFNVVNEIKLRTKNCENSLNDVNMNICDGANPVIRLYQTLSRLNVLCHLLTCVKGKSQHSPGVSNYVFVALTWVRYDLKVTCPVRKRYDLLVLKHTNNMSIFNYKKING